jgi:hypothetical protein
LLLKRIKVKGFEVHGSLFTVDKTEVSGLRSEIIIKDKGQRRKVKGGKVHGSRFTVEGLKVHN